MKSFLSFTIISTLLSYSNTFVNASPNLAKRASGVTNSPTNANGQTFDYIVIGGGLAGTTVAARLAENAGITVLLVEAGADNRSDAIVYDIHKYGQAFGTNLDWQFPADSGKSISAGKTLGGGTSINGAAYTRAHTVQYNALTTLLEPNETNVGWNSVGMFNYMRKSEAFTAPTASQQSKGAQSVASYHGTQGPVQVAFPSGMYAGPHQPNFINTVTAITGMDHCADLNGGSNNCVTMTPLTINPHDSDHRSSSPAAYLTPVESVRTNWLTLVQHQVTKILFSNPGSIPLTASGVQFAPASGGSTRYQAFARREVIVAAGAVMTPTLLQLSGIGDSAVLNPLGITTLLDLKAVGRNLQEQTMSVLGASAVSSFDPQGSGPVDAIAYPNLYQLFDSTTANNLVNQLTNNISSIAAAQAALGSGISAQALETIYTLQAGMIANAKVPVVEVFLDVGYPDALGLLVWNLLPFSRGNIKITSTNPFTKPQIKVNYFSADFDMQVQIGGTRLGRKIFSTAPFKNIVKAETTPAGAVPNDSNSGSDASWRNWIKGNYMSVAHPIGSCAMMKRSLGGCVNSQLKVYDTTNLRIVDASVLPMQISAHLAATLFGVAEKAADLIKNSQ